MEKQQADDKRIGVLVADVDELKQQMLINTAITKQVRDILESFKIMAAIAKWVTIISASVAAVWHGFEAVRHFLGGK